MAIVVCVTEIGDEANWSQSAIYVNQDFYELFFNYYERTNRDSPFRKIISIGYDDELRIGASQVSEVAEELETISSNGRVFHPQVESLLNIFHEAAAMNYELVVGGDMYPDLSKRSRYF